MFRAKVFLLTVSKLPATSRLPNSMYRAMFKNSRLGFANRMSIHFTLNSFRFDSCVCVCVCNITKILKDCKTRIR
jgi:hypothetical protein